METTRLQLQPRLQCIASLVPKGARLADIGTDHGYLPVYLLQEGTIGHAIVSDINALPLAHARATAAEYGVTEKLDFRLCPGLAKLRPEECDTVAIAGMGGETILGILEAAPWTRDGAHTLILRGHPLYGEYLSLHLTKLRRARDGLAVSSLADKDARIAHLTKLIEELERRKGEWEHGNGT